MDNSKMTNMVTKTGNGIQIISSNSHSEEKTEGWILRVFNLITVEPSLLFCILPSTMYQITTMNLYLEKTCRVHFSWNRTVCDSLSERRTFGYEVEEAEVQKHVSQMFAISTFIQGFFPVCLILFLGAWSDTHGRRKPLILAPIIGEILAVIMLILNTIYFDELPVIFIVISVSLPPALMGGWPCLLLGVYSHLSSSTDNETRTTKIGISSTIQNVAFIIGLGSTGFLLKPIGFIGIYTICLIMLIISFLYGLLRIRDKDLCKEEIDGISNGRYCFDLLRLKHLKSTVSTLFRNGQHEGKKNILMIFALCIIALGPIQGENAVCYLYTRLKFGWNELDFSIFFLVHSLMDIIGSFLAVGLLGKYFKWRDQSIGILALCTTICAEVLYAFAPNYKYFYGGIILDIFYTITPIVLRSLMSKVVPENEIGRSNSVYGLIEALEPLIFGPIYSTVYENTIENFPGSFYFISIGLYTSGICLFIYYNKGSPRPEGGVEENEKLKDTHDLDVNPRA